MSMNRDSQFKYRQEQFSTKGSALGIEKTSSYLKKQIAAIIKKQLKAYRIHSQLAFQLEAYQKNQLNQKLSKSLLEDKLQSFRCKQTDSRKQQYEIFLKKKKQRQERLKSFMKLKRGQHENRFAGINMSLQNVKDRYATLALEDCNLRLSKITPCVETGNNNSNISYKSQNSRAISASMSQTHHDTVREMQEEREKMLVNNFLSKAARSESKVLMQEMQNQKRKEVSLKKSVKCLVNLRQKQEEQKMNKVQKEYDTRMQKFTTNHSRIAQMKESMLQNRALMSSNTRRKVIQKKDFVIKQHVDGIIEDCNKRGKENIMKRYKSTLDLNLTRKNQIQNFMKMKSEAKNASLQNMMKILFKKLQKIKNINYGEKLDDLSIQIVLSLLDKNDPEYATIMEFLKSQRKSFIEAIIKKEEEKSKLKKMTKPLSKCM